MFIRTLLFILVDFVLLIGCSSPTTLVETSIPPPTITLIPSKTPEIQIITTSTPLVSPSSPPTATFTPTPVYTMCSPLGFHPLEELPTIISDPYKPPPPGREERHHGVDFGYWHYKERDSMLGEPVQAVLAGLAASVINDLYPYGNMVMIETPRAALPPELIKSLKIQEGESLYLLYAHLNQSPMVGLGDRVQACQPLGEVGMSGNTDIAHLHLETRLGPAGARFKSMRFYDTQASIEEIKNYKLWRTSGQFRHFDPMNLLGFPNNP